MFVQCVATYVWDGKCVCTQVKWEAGAEDLSRSQIFVLLCYFSRYEQSLIRQKFGPILHLASTAVLH